MNRSTRTRVRLAAFLAACGIFIGAPLLAPNQSHNLADYGASNTAQIGMEHAQAEGVQHQHNGGHDRD